MLTRLEEPEEIEEPEEPVRSIVLGDGTVGATHTFSAVTVTSLGRSAIVTDNQARCADQTRRSESMGAASFAGRSGRQAHSGGLRQAPDDLIAPRRRAARFDRQLSFVPLLFGRLSSVRECVRWRLDVPAPAAEKATLSAAPRLLLARLWTRGGRP